MLKPVPYVQWLLAARRAGAMLKRQDGRRASVGYIRRVLDASPFDAARTLACMDVDPGRSDMERACVVRLLMHRESRADQLYLMGVL